MTIDHYPCKFPFWYGGKIHFKCANAKRSDLPHGIQWCPIDSKKLYFKSIGICSETCLQSKSFSCLSTDFIGKYIFFFSVTENLSIILIAGGDDQNSKLASAESIISDTNNNLLPNLPKPIHYSPSMFLHNDTIMLCGGKNNQNNPKTCLKLQEGSWTENNSLKKTRVYAAIVSTTTATFIFGGSRSRGTFEYLEQNTSNWILGTAKIPGGFSSGCSIAISQDEIWLIGGGGYKTDQRILSFNVNNQNFTVLPTKLKQGRATHQCAFIPGTRNMIVTGGYFFSDGAYFDTTEIIDVKTRNVTEGPSMNSKRGGHGIGILNIEGMERVVVFGGVYHDSEWIYLKSVEMYNAETQKWELTNIELSEAKGSFGFMTIKSQP